jgi:hypothetical protein
MGEPGKNGADYWTGADKWTYYNAVLISMEYLHYWYKNYFI